VASISIRVTSVKGGEKEIYLAPTWAVVNVHLESAAVGVNSLGYGPTRSEFMAAETRNLILAPGTRLMVETTSSSPVTWGMHITELTFIDDVVQALCTLGQG